MNDLRSYHGQPVIKEPVWTWEIPCYFYTGGLAGASAGLAYLSGLRGNRELSRNAWTAAAIGVTLSPALLTSDLGKPARFLNMLRMFKVTSPMSVGSWILTGSGAATSVAALNAWTGRFPRLAVAARPAAAVFGLPLSTYTAALIANTAVPVWHEARRMLPFVFGAGAALSAGGMTAAITAPPNAGPARRLAVGGAVLEVGLVAVMEKRLGLHEEVYRRGASAKFSQLARGCTLIGTGLLATRGAKSRAAAVAGGVLVSAGALSARWSIFKAGFASAADPKYVVEPQRAAAERRNPAGAARTTPAVEPQVPVQKQPTSISRATVG